MSLTSWLRSASVSEAEVRAEIWRLGARHRGWPLEGALDELKAPGIESKRADLLRACVRKLKRTQGPKPADAGRPNHSGS